MNEEKELLGNVEEYMEQAEYAVSKSHINSAVTLYFKVIAVLVDLFLLKKEGFIPSNHKERFRILEIKYPLIYNILDKDFPIYQNSYRIKLDKQYAEVFKNDIKKIIEFTDIKIN